ncbi:MAG: flagellar basal body P-ring formation chaperone FlgA [Pseudolabrys sp.]
MIRKLAIAAAALLAFSAAAAATPDEEHPKLRAEAIVTGSIVRIGDLVDHAGIIAKVPIFRAPDLGATGTVSAEAVVEAVRPFALIGLDTGDVSEVVVTRASRAIPAKIVEERVAQALSAQYALGPAKDIVVHFERDLRAIHVEPSAKGDPRVANLNFDDRSGRFDVTLDMPTGATTRGTLRLAGQAAATTEVVTMARQVERGEVIKTSDVIIERRPRGEIGRDVVGNIDQAVGLAARAALKSGQPLRVADLMKPVLVQHNETVTLIYQMPGVRLTVRGKATEGGAEGDVINVLNEQSKRTVQGVVAGPGRVVINAGAPRLAAGLPPGQ